MGIEFLAWDYDSNTRRSETRIMTKESELPGVQRGPLAFEDRQFLMRDEMRAQRLALDYERAEIAMREQRIKSTVVVFGSARAKPPDDLDAGVTSPQTCGPASGDLEDLTYWYREAYMFAKIVSERGGALTAGDGPRENVIATGAGPGIMEAANRGARAAGAPTIGFNINVPAEQVANPYVSPNLSFYFHYFAVRKMHFAMRANALAAFPGGFGTLDEVFEILTLKQTNRTRAMPVILFSRRYWERVVNFEALRECGTIDQDDLALFDIVDSAEEGWQRMLDRGLKQVAPVQDDEPGSDR